MKISARTAAQQLTLLMWFWDVYSDGLPEIKWWMEVRRLNRMMWWLSWRMRRRVSVMIKIRAVWGWWWWLWWTCVPCVSSASAAENRNCCPACTPSVRDVYLLTTHLPAQPATSNSVRAAFTFTHSQMLSIHTWPIEVVHLKMAVTEEELLEQREIRFIYSQNGL